AQEQGGLEGKVDKPGSGDGDVVGGGGGSGKGSDQLFGDGAGVELAGFGVAEDAVGLEIAMPRIGGADLGCEAGCLQSRSGRGSQERRIEIGGEVKGDRHWSTVA